MNAKKIVREIDQLKPIPQVAFQILELAENPDRDASEVAKLIVHDIAITANILKTINSAYYGFNRKIESINDAVVLLGMNSIIQLALMQVAAVNLKNAYSGYGLHDGQLWEHSASSAILAKMIAEQLDLPNIHFVFTVSLLKDIGKVIMNQYVEGSREKIYGGLNDNTDYLSSEKKALGVNHAEMGAAVAKRWNFSDNMIEIIQHHHSFEPGQQDNPAACAVYLADNLCSMMGIGTGSDGLVYKFDNRITDFMDIDQTGIESLIAEFTQQKNKLGHLIRSF